MQLITLASAAALLATASASTSFNLNSSCIDTEPKVRVFNRCPYKVHLWSVLQGQGCPAEDGAVVPEGGFYQENFRPAVDGVGTSIKISKTSQCKGVDCLQLEYYIETSKPGYNYNYLDVSYVDCGNGGCPTKQEGFYLKSGNEDGQFMANAVNEICPILSCSSPEECAKVAYINPDDRQTKSCDPKANLDFYMCVDSPTEGSPSGGDDYSAAPAASSSTPVEEEPEATTTEAPAYTQAEYEVNAAAVTPGPKKPNTKTQIVYVTEYATVAAKKRHVHGHRHQHFRA